MTKPLLLLFLVISVSSCLNPVKNNSDGKPQEFPSFDFSNLDSIVIKKRGTVNPNRILEKERVILLSNFFLDSTNYFKKIKYNAEGKRSLLTLKIWKDGEVLNLFIYPVDKGKIPIGYFDSKDLEKSNGFKEFKHFYVSEKLNDLVQKWNK
ncbi:MULTISPECIES: hypothetical protein [Flavobacteriaceae]|uniref:hypothetical protein n=1 Tax=Flavobacteriaceae TaxID=49546 RepID=UPI0023496AEF|nr:hypothetical protein [Muricauda sp. SP22]MDC6364111.1 hypothetical protein [Muricauda sp. SP22]